MLSSIRTHLREQKVRYATLEYEPVKKLLKLTDYEWTEEIQGGEIVIVEETPSYLMLIDWATHEPIGRVSGKPDFSCVVGVIDKLREYDDNSTEEVKLSYFQKVLLVESEGDPDEAVGYLELGRAVSLALQEAGDETEGCGKILTLMVIFIVFVVIIFWAC